MLQRLVSLPVWAVCVKEEGTVVCSIMQLHSGALNVLVLCILKKSILLFLTSPSWVNKVHWIDPSIDIQSALI